MAQKEIIEATALLNAVKSWAGGKFAPQPVTAQITIATTDWSNGSATKSVTGMTTKKIVIVCPATTSISGYVASGIRATAQGAGTLTFSCDNTPSGSIVVNVFMQESSAGMILNTNAGASVQFITPQEIDALFA